MTTSHGTRSRSGNLVLAKADDDLHSRGHGIAYLTRAASLAELGHLAISAGVGLAWLPLVAFHATSEAVLRFLGIVRGEETEVESIDAPEAGAEIFHLKRKPGEFVGKDGK